MTRVIHRIWLGGDEPAWSRAWAAAWQESHPDWVVHTWDDVAVATLPLRSRAWYWELPGPVHRADVLRVELVRRFGGVYVDADMEPLRPITAFVPSHGAWCTPDADGIPGGAFFGGDAFASVWDRMLDLFAERWRDTPSLPPNHLFGPFAWRDLFGADGDGWITVLGTPATAYPFHWNEPRVLMDDPDERAARCARSLMIHRYAGTWT